MDVGGLEAGSIAFDEEPADAVFCARPDDGDIGHRTVRDPRFFAIEHPGSAVANCARAHAGRIRTEVGFGQTEAANRFPRLEARKPVIFLLLRTVLKDREHDQRSLHGNKTSDGGVAALEFLHFEAVLDVAHSSATVAFEVCAQEYESRHFRD